MALRSPQHHGQWPTPASKSVHTNLDGEERQGNFEKVEVQNILKLHLCSDFA
jgi:hypothetical protein